MSNKSDVFKVVVFDMTNGRKALDEHFCEGRENADLLLKKTKGEYSRPLFARTTKHSVELFQLCFSGSKFEWNAA